MNANTLTPFPHHYVVELSNEQLVAAPRPPIDVGTPMQFGGTDHVWGPEELLAGAALTCLWTTFLAYARRAHISDLEWSGRAVAVLERGRPPVLTSIELTVDVRVPAEQVADATRALANAERDCIVARALKVPVIVRPSIAARQAAAIDAIC